MENPNASNASTAASQYAPGLGTLGFNDDERRSAFGRIRVGEDEFIEVRGTYTAYGATLEGDGVAVAVTCCNRGARGPRLKGSLIFTESGLVKQIVVWPPKHDDAVGYGISEDLPFESRQHQPF